MIQELEIIDDMPDDLPEDEGREGETPEQRAARYGWKPEDEYQGKSPWADAETFLKKIDDDGLEAKKMLRNLENRYAKLEKTTDAIYSHQQRQLEAAEKQGYERAMNEVNQRLAKAVEDGDIAAAKDAIADRDKLSKGAGASGAYTQDDHAYADQWKSKNAWFGKDPVLTDAAARISAMKASEGGSVKEQLEEAEKYVRETWPHKFRQIKEPVHMPGGGSGVRSDLKPKMGTYDALTKEMKVECDKCVKDITSRTKRTVEEAKAEFLKFATPDMFVEGAK